MSETHASPLPLVAEGAADPEVVQRYDDIKRTLEIPFVPNIHKMAANSPAALNGMWEALHNIFLQTSLPVSLASMILFSISAAKKCQYCSAIHQVTCKTLGVEEDTLAALDSNLDALAPQRVQVIVRFAQKCALDPQNLQSLDYETVRAQGIGDQELMEIIALAGLGNFLDTLADGMKVEVDSVFAEALGG